MEIIRESRYILAAAWFFFISLLSVIVTICDKRRAKQGKWRIRESHLLLLGALGGAAAMYITMRKIHHKTKHLKFMIGLPVFFVLHLVLLIFVIRKGVFLI